MADESNQSLSLERNSVKVEESMVLNPTAQSDEYLQDSLATKDSLAAVLTHQGRYEEAATLLKEILNTRGRLGQSKVDSGMLRTMNNLGAALNHQGCFDEAEELHRQVLESDEQRLGSESDATITDMNNLAAVLQNQGKLDEAQQMQQRAFELSQKVHGPEAPETLGIMGNLGDILLRHDKYEQAETISREVLALRQKVLREYHPDIARGMHNLAAVLKKRGKLDEAEELHRQEIALHRTGMEGITGTNNVAEPPANQGYYDKVEEKLRDKVRLSIEASGKSSRQARSDMNDLGTVLLENGKYKEAEDTFRTALVAGTA